MHSRFERRRAETAGDTMTDEEVGPEKGPDRLEVLTFVAPRTRPPARARDRTSAPADLIRRARSHDRVRPASAPRTRRDGSNAPWARAWLTGGGTDRW